MTEWNQPGMLNEIRREGTFHALISALFVFMAGVIFSLAAALYGALMGLADTALISAIIFFTFGILAFSLGASRLNWTSERAHDLLKRVYNHLDAVTEEIWAKSELPTSTYLPTSTEETPREIPLTGSVGQGGKYEERTITLDYVNGFDPRDLDYMALFLANGGRTSEGVLEHIALPYQRVKLGGIKAGTRATEFLDLCEAKGILSARDGEHKKPGKLLITDEAEIKRLLKSP